MLLWSGSSHRRKCNTDRQGGLPVRNSASSSARLFPSHRRGTESTGSIFSKRGYAGSIDRVWHRWWVTTKFFSDLISGEKYDVGSAGMAMTEATLELNEVIIKADKPFLEQKIDRTIVNVQGSANFFGKQYPGDSSKSPVLVVNNQNQ